MTVIHSLAHCFDNQYDPEEYAVRFAYDFTCDALSILISHDVLEPFEHILLHVGFRQILHSDALISSERILEDVALPTRRANFHCAV